ncbi:hypothetical protein CEXT_733731 [Caerostris extrusa]|uniref:Uncharacterized protein n=1 Tax=Caerostris extrusa TaxID=172846 RepID=A0AAV4SWU8_CAEEX|nr:hypothetical protein CEXT_733731 [Caerostris extrusa]
MDDVNLLGATFADIDWKNTGFSETTFTHVFLHPSPCVLVLCILRVQMVHEPIIPATLNPSPSPIISAQSRDSSLLLYAVSGKSYLILETIRRSQRIMEKNSALVF